jgi:hypothetical protein
VISCRARTRHTYERMSADTRPIVTFHADRFPRLGLPDRLPADGAR